MCEVRSGRGQWDIGVSSQDLSHGQDAQYLFRSYVLCITFRYLESRLVALSYRSPEAPRGGMLDVQTELVVPVPLWVVARAAGEDGRLYALRVPVLEETDADQETPLLRVVHAGHEAAEETLDAGAPTGGPHAEVVGDEQVHKFCAHIGDYNAVDIEDAFFITAEVSAAATLVILSEGVGPAVKVAVEEDVDVLQASAIVDGLRRRVVNYICGTFLLVITLENPKKLS